MALVSFSVNAQQIFAGTGYIFRNLQRPGANARLLVDGNNPPNISYTANAWAASTAYALDAQVLDASGNLEQVIVAGTSGAALPTWSTVIGGVTTDATVQWQNLGAPAALGATDAVAATVALDGKTLPAEIDQETAPVGYLMSAESAELDIELKQTGLDKISYLMPHAGYSTGTDTGLPAGAQAYEQITVGGMVNIPHVCWGIVLPQRQYVSTSKSIVICLTKMAPAGGVSFPFTRTKISTFKGKLQGAAVESLPLGQRVATWYRQT